MLPTALRCWRHLAALLLAATVQAGAWAQAAEPPWAAHGRLQASANGHYIQHADGTPFLWIGDTAWAMVQNLRREEVDAYLDHRQRLGFTVVQTVAHWYPHGGGLPSGPGNQPNAYGHRPFAGSDDTYDTATPAIVPGGSPTAPNDYWDHLDYIVQAVRQRGMVLGLVPMWGRAYVTAIAESSRQQYDAPRAAAFGGFLGERYRSEPHIVWLVGGDTRALIEGYDKAHAPMRHQDARAIFRALAEGIGSGVSGRALAWNRADAGWDQVFMTFHPDGDAPYSSAATLHDDVWLDANGVEVWRQLEQTHGVMLADYQRRNPAKPSLFLEGSYEYGSYRHECGWVTPVKVRRQFYHSFFGGAAGHTYGAAPVWAMRGTGGDYNCGYTWQQALHFPGAAQLATVGQAFVRAHGWWRWVPDGRFIDGVGEGESFKAAVLDAAAGRAIVYFSNRTAAGIRNLLPGPASAAWTDPRSGLRVPAGDFASGELRTMLPPARWEDALLVLELGQ